MPVNPLTTAGGGASAAALRALSTSLAKEEFLQLLVLQLQHQDPLNPMSDREFIAQMAQIETLAATNGLATQLQDLAAAQQQTLALQLVGREVEFRNATGEAVSGRVTGVELGGAAPVLLVDEHRVSPGQVLKVV